MSYIFTIIGTALATLVINNLLGNTLLSKFEMLLNNAESRITVAIHKKL